MTPERTENSSQSETLPGAPERIRLTEGLCQSVVIMLGLFVFLNPFPHTTALKEITLYGSLAVALYLFASGKRPLSWSSPLTTPFLFLILWSAAGIFFALDRANSLHDVLSHLLKYLTFLFLLITFYPSRRHLQALAWIVILSTTIFVIASMVHFYVILDHSFADRLGYSVEYNGGHSFFEMSANYMGFITVFAALLSINQFVKEGHGARKALLALCFVATVTATLLTQTRGAVIALVLAVILVGMSNRRGLVLAVLLPVLVASVIFTTAGSRERFNMKTLQSNERIGIVLMYGEMIKEHPVKGIGFGMELLQKKDFMTPYYERVPEAYRDPGFNVSPHNFYLDIAVRLGAVGLLLYLVIIFTAFRMTWQSRGSCAESTDKSDTLCLAASFGAVLVQSLFADSSFGPPAIVFYLHLAMITILWRTARRVGSSPSPAGAIP
jgi:O-antigen ligase